MKIDYDKLRSDLIDYLGTAINYYPMVVVEIEEVKKASDNELLIYARQHSFNVEDYAVGKTYHRYKI